jgi:tRNA threonylcarbamoyladenosine biosynthesis protein TsaE
LEGLDCPDWVVSPTYTLVEEYQVPLCKVYHLDLYRLGDPQEVEGMGIRDWQDGQSILLIEWPEQGFGKLPDPHWRVDISCPESGRVVFLDGPHTLATLEAYGSF